MPQLSYPGRMMGPRLLGGGGLPPFDPTLPGNLGDSIDEFNFNSGTNLAQRQTGLIMNTGLGGEITHAAMYDPRINFLAYNDLADNTGLLANNGRYYGGGDVGRAGATLADILAEIPRMISYNPAIVILGGGTNSLTDVNFQADYTAILDAIHAGLPSCQILCETIRAVSFSAHIGLNRTAAQIAAANVLLAAAVASRSSFAHLIDLSAYTNDAGNPGYGLDINYATAPYQPVPGGDGLHPGYYGAQLLGAPAHLQWIQTYMPAGNAILGRKISSVLPAGMGTNQGSVVISKSATGGGIGTITGFVPTNMTVSFGAAGYNSSVVCSKPDANTLRLTITSAGAATIEQFIIQPSAIAIVTAALQGRWARMWANVSVDQTVGWLNMVLSAAERSNSANNFTNGQFGILPDTLGSNPRVLWPVTSNLQFPGASTGVNPSIIIKFDPSTAAGPMVIDLLQWDIQTEASPVRGNSTF